MITFDYLLEIPMDVTLGASMVEDIEDYVDKHLSVLASQTVIISPCEGVYRIGDVGYVRESDWDGFWLDLPEWCHALFMLNLNAWYTDILDENDHLYTPRTLGKMTPWDIWDTWHNYRGDLENVYSTENPS